MSKARGPLDLMDQIMAYESGEMDDGQTIEFFQELVNTGLINQLQGSYQRAASDLLRAGLITV